MLNELEKKSDHLQNDYLRKEQDVKDESDEITSILPNNWGGINKLRSKSKINLRKIQKDKKRR